MNVLVKINDDGSKVKGYLKWEDDSKRSVIFVPINLSSKKKGQ